MNYQQTLTYLYKQLPMYQRIGAAAYKNDLNNTLALDKMFDFPHRRFKSIHIAGTNGKGSVSHQVAAILQCAGYNVGLYTSPHLKDYRERIRVNGEVIAKEFVVDFVQRFQSKNEDDLVQPSFFELSVLMAFDYFATQKVDIAVVEVGLGGRLDSTNIISPEVSVITNISLDHTHLLGNSIEKIAEEKAGIMKSNIPVVVGESQLETSSVFDKKAKAVGTSCTYADQRYNVNIVDDKFEVICEGAKYLLNTELKGFYQKRNIPTVLATIHTLEKKGWKVSRKNIIDGFERASKLTGLMGRWQRLCEKPTVICDTGHNEAGIKIIVEQLSAEEYDKLHIVFGTVNDKNIDGVLSLLPKDAMYYFVKAKIDRAMDANKLHEMAVQHQLNGRVCTSVKDGLEEAKSEASESDLIFVGGSTFVVAEVL